MNEKRNALLLGTLIPEEIAKEYMEYGISPAAADNAQRYILNGLSKNDRIKSVTAICAPRLPSAKNCGIEIVKSSAQEYQWGTLHNVGYDNTGIGFLAREKAMLRYVKKWLMNTDFQNGIVLIYSMNSTFLKIAKMIKRLEPSALVCIFVGDLPLYMSDYAPISVRSVLKHVNWMQIKVLLKYVDKYALYTKYMADYLKLKKEEWIVFEGVVDAAKIDLSTIEKNNRIKKCLYAGSLHPVYHIDKLIEAFSSLSNEAELFLYGERIESIVSQCESVPNCHYKGLLTADKVFEEMRNMDLLVNPRPSDLELSKYSCPSKTFEYMASGTPVCMNRLKGLPDEYSDYLFFFEQETVDGYRRKLAELFKKDSSELAEFGKRAQSFLLNNKTEYLQVKRVIDFLLSDTCRKEI